MAEVRVLVAGIHEKLGDGLRISSSVTLIKSDKNIIVDTGSFLDGKRIIEELKREGLTPDDIDIVILTHMHLDHVVNVHLFRNARIFCKFLGKGYPGQFHIPREGSLQRYDLSDGAGIADGVEILLTPGHTGDMISVLVRTDKGRVVVAGDAFPSEAFLNPEKQPLLFNDLEAFNESRKKILEIADYIVPGHGKMFRVER